MCTLAQRNDDTVKQLEADVEGLMASKKNTNTVKQLETDVEGLMASKKRMSVTSIIAGPVLRIVMLL